MILPGQERETPLDPLRVESLLAYYGSTKANIHTRFTSKGVMDRNW